MTLQQTIDAWEQNGTKGPWDWTCDDSFGYTCYNLGPGVFTTDLRDGTPWGDEYDQANTTLIAAAPDMAKALKAAVELADSVDVMNEIAGQQALANLMRDLKAFREAMG